MYKNNLKKELTKNLTVIFLCVSLLYPAACCGRHLRAAGDEETTFSFEAELSDLPPLQRTYLALREQADQLEQELSTQEKILSTLTSAVLSFAFEMTHLWVTQSYSPEYFYKNSAPGQLPDFFPRIWELCLTTLKNRHTSLILTSAASWYSLYGGFLPGLAENAAFLHLGAVAGLTAASYGILTSNMIWKGNFEEFSFKNLGYLGRLEGRIIRDMRRDDFGRDWFLAVRELDNSKQMLQAAMIATLFCWNVLSRFWHKAELKDVRASLTLARDRMTQSFPNNHEQKVPFSSSQEDEKGTVEAKDTEVKLKKESIGSRQRP